MLAPQAEVMMWGTYTLTMTLANNVLCTGTIRSSSLMSSIDDIINQAFLDSRYGSFKGLSKVFRSSTPMYSKHYP